MHVIQSSLRVKSGLALWLNIQYLILSVRVALLSSLLLSSSTLFSQIYTEHSNPRPGQEYDSIIVGSCSSCSITDAVYVSDTSPQNYSSVYISSGSGNGAIIRGRLSKMANTGVSGFFLENNLSGLLASTVLNNITLRTYKNGVFQDSASGSSKLSIGVLSGSIQFVEMPVNTPFNEIEIEFQGFTSADWDVNLYRGYANATALPVDLTFFSAEAQDDGSAILRWETASESNNSHFEILRSVNNSNNFEPIGEMMGAGNSVIIQKYRFEDVDVTSSHPVCYKLRQYDFDGKSMEFTIDCVEPVTSEDISKVNIYPNPSPDGSVNFDFPDDANRRVELHNLQGEVIRSVTTHNNSEIKLNNLLPGFYVATSTNLETGITNTFKLIIR